jgi:ribosome-associated protein
MTEEGEDYKSKTRRKRESEHQQDIAEQLLRLKRADLEQIELPGELVLALEETRKIHSRAALRRQRQYLGKLMRNCDSEHIEAQLQAVLHRHDTNTARFKRIETWRDRLLEGEDTALNEIIEKHPDVDRQHIHALVRQARKEQQLDKPPAAARKLFRYLREMGD